MKKNEFILIIVAVILVIVLGIGFYMDNNKKLIKRTIDLEVTEDMEIISMEKRGFLLYRTGYSAKIKIDYDNDPELLFNAFKDTYHTEGLFLTYDEYIKFAGEVLDKERIKPTPLQDSLVYVLGVEDMNKQEVVYILDTEGAESAYLYIYFAR